jgi:cellulose synthase/poly-beta-1,6-N-acetylglucosamine synthase-like glycosyltransferase
MNPIPAPFVDRVAAPDGALHTERRGANPGTPRRSPRWWHAIAVLAASATLATAAAALGLLGESDAGGLRWWLVTLVLHSPYALIVVFLVAGLVERIGFHVRGRPAISGGRLPDELPRVCVQLPMFNEHEVAPRLIRSVAALDWPRDRLQIQVLDDSTDEDTRRLVDDVCRDVRAATGIDCRVLRRADRSGYKAGALEEGRLRTDAELLLILDADFVPPTDLLRRAVRHFYDAAAQPIDDLALVQCQWGHLNHEESSLTAAQSLWVDDHHTLQMSWRSAQWGFVNFTGTAGIWRASAIEAAGGWRAASLVEDCELSFRALFAGYRTTFVKEIVVPAELPATYTAYKAQQKRWTQGWVQLQRMHLRTLATKHPCGPVRRFHLLYHMCIPWQWPAWALWVLVLPHAIATGHWFGSTGLGSGLLLYLVPTVLWAAVATITASTRTLHTYPDPPKGAELRRRVARVVPYLVLNAGMLPHQLCAFAEGLFGPMHGEFERTPKTAAVTAGAATPNVAAVRRDAPRRYAVRIHWPYVLAEAWFVAHQAAWITIFLSRGLVLCAVGAAAMAGCVLRLAWYYGDHLGRRAFVFTARGPSPALDLTGAPAGVVDLRPAGETIDGLVHAAAPTRAP